MRNRIVHIALLFALFSSGCADLLMNNKSDDSWNVKQSGRIAIHYRAQKFSAAQSPTDAVVDTLIINQNYFYTRIIDTLKVKFTGTVMVYLYNYDEAKSIIGTNGGGYAVPQYLTYYYTYIPYSYAMVSVFGRKDKLGAHELTHVIAENTLGPGGTRMFLEGLAMFVDNTYAGKYTEDIMRSFYPAGRILTINYMLNSGDSDESIYYPNAGMFIKYLAGKYGIEKVKQLYTSVKEEMNDAFIRITGKSIDEIQSDYSEYLRIKFAN